MFEKFIFFSSFCKILYKYSLKHGFHVSTNKGENVTECPLKLLSKLNFRDTEHLLLLLTFWTLYRKLSSIKEKKKN